MGGITISEIAKDLIINIINIIILFVIVKALVYKPVKKFLDARTARIEDLKKQTEDSKKQADEAFAGYNKMLNDSKTEGTEIIGKAEQTAKENSKQIIDNAKKSAQAIIDKAHSDIEAEHTAMVSSMQDEIGSMALDISEKILSRNVTDADNRKIAEAFFNSNN